jgi:hypothetical protein
MLPGMKKNPGGAVTLDIQNREPGKARESARHRRVEVAYRPRRASALRRGELESWISPSNG